MTGHDSRSGYKGSWSFAPAERTDRGDEGRGPRALRVGVVGLKPNKDLAYVNELFEAGKLTPVVDRTYALARVPDALRRFGTGDHMGTIIIRIA